VNREAAEAAITQEGRAGALDEWRQTISVVAAAARSTLRLAGDARGAERIVINPYPRGNAAEEEISIVEEGPES
jgi:hypothetical protein